MAITATVPRLTAGAQAIMIPAAMAQATAAADGAAAGAIAMMAIITVPARDTGDKGRAVRMD